MDISLYMENKTTIVVERVVVTMLSGFKLHPRETNNDCLKRVLTTTEVPKDE